jgi:hypothetical protein
MPAFADQSTSELRANLLARRAFAEEAAGWRKRDALRDVREIEEELQARGEKLEEPKPKRQGRPEHLTRWYAVGFHDRPGWPVPPSNKRHIDRSCVYLADKPEEGIRELADHEIAGHQPCLGCAG